MNSNYEWQEQYTNQRLQQRRQESRQHRLSKQHEEVSSNEASSIIRFPARLVNFLLGLIR